MVVYLAFSDVWFLFVGLIGLFLTVMVGNYAIGVLMPELDDYMTPEMNTSINDSWDNNVAIYNGSFVAIWFIFMVLTIVLTITLQSHPAFLILWLFFNIVFLWVYDAMLQFLIPFLDSEINTGDLDDASSFLLNDIGKFTIFVNIILGAVLFGKNAGWV